MLCISERLSEACRRGDTPTDGYLKILLGLLANRLGGYVSACELLLDGIISVPACFLAWEQLGLAISHCEGQQRELLAEKVVSLLNLSPFFPILEVYLLGEFRICLPQLSGLGGSVHETRRLALGGVSSPLFEGCRFIFHQRALATYNAQMYEECRMNLQKMQEIDPQAINGFDCLSDILFLEDDRNGLYKAAMQCEKHQKFHPITCYVYGNYHALIGEHEEAALFFRRAIRLNPALSSAWILIAQQYLELKQPEAAIDAYLHATGSLEEACTLPCLISLNPKSFHIHASSHY